MQRRRLDGWFMTTKEKAHQHIKRRLRLPAYYGCNLDALCDCLSEIGVPTHIALHHAAALKRRLGPYGGKLISTLIACTGENPRLHVTVRERW